MHAPSPPSASGRIHSPLVICLQICAVLAAALGPLYAVARLYDHLLDGGRLTASVAFASAGLALLGLAGGCLLWAAAALVKRLLSPAALPAPSTPWQNAANDTPQPPGPVSPPPPAIDPRLLQEMLATLGEINANLLLSDEQRRAKAAPRLSEMAAHVFEQGRAAVAARDFDAAEKARQSLLRNLNDPRRYSELGELMAQGRQLWEQEKLASGLKRIEELMSLTSFRQAMDLAGELCAQHPQSAEARTMLERVTRESEAFSGEQRRRLFAEVQRSAEGRQWLAAFAAAQKLLTDYPTSPEADKVASIMPTIQENCRIEEVRELRNDLKDLIQRRRYAQAVKIARDIVARFPDTQAAAELRPQIEKLQELARD